MIFTTYRVKLQMDMSIRGSLISGRDEDKNPI
jgi:hypothetical protein